MHPNDRVISDLRDRWLDPPDYDEEERCDECGERFPCACVQADRANDEEWSQ